MDPLWKQITIPMVEDVLNESSHVYKVEDGEHYLVNRTGIRDTIHLFIEKFLESYEFKK